MLTTPAAAEEVRRAVAATPGVADATVGESAGQVAQVQAVLAAAPGTPEGDAAVRELRARLDSVGDGRALVGGAVATDLDTRDAAGRDRRVIVPLILLVVLLVLALLLRALVAPLVLVATVVASFFAALGAGWLVSDRILDFPAFDYSVPLLSFLFLVALGVDYNIFLTTRAREEAAQCGTRSGVVVALSATGGVITSAGILLAAVFTVLGVLPVVLLTQIGVIVALGVLLDTLLVRSVLVPALTSLLGRHFWWPSGLSGTEPPRPEPAAAAATGEPAHRREPARVAGAGSAALPARAVRSSSHSTRPRRTPGPRLRIEAAERAPPTKTARRSSTDRGHQTLQREPGAPARAKPVKTIPVAAMSTRFAISRRAGRPAGHRIAVLCGRHRSIA